MSVFQKILHLGEGKKLKDLEALVAAVNDLEPSVEPLSDEELRAKTEEFRARLKEGETLDDIEAEAYAVVRERDPAAALLTGALGEAYFRHDVAAFGSVILSQEEDATPFAKANAVNW